MWDLLENFDAFNILAISRSKNQHANRLAAVGTQYDIVRNIKVQSNQEHIKVPFL